VGRISFCGNSLNHFLYIWDAKQRHKLKLIGHTSQFVFKSLPSNFIPKAEILVNAHWKMLNVLTSLAFYLNFGSLLQLLINLFLF